MSHKGDIFPISVGSLFFLCLKAPFLGSTSSRKEKHRREREAFWVRQEFLVPYTSGKGKRKERKRGKKIKINSFHL